MRRFVSLLFIASLLILAVVPAVAQSEDGFLRYPITVDPEHMNPFISDTIAIGTVTRNIFEGLTRVDPVSGDILPAVAESWDIETNDAGQQIFTFHLREGVLFHEVAGVELADREVTADDVLWNYLVALHPDEDISIRSTGLEFILGAPEYTAALEEMGDDAPLIMEDASVEGLQVVDDYTFQITLSAPD